MARPRRSVDWGFPRWRGYGSERAAEKVRLCDRHGCDEPGNCPAPKSPNNPDRWYFCQKHAAEYNSGWDYFEGLTKEEAEQREARERRDAGGFRQSAHHEWAGSGDGTRTRDELRALEFFGLEPDADFDAVKQAWRKVAKETHPDVRPGDAEAADQFAKGQAAFNVLKTAEELREWRPAGA